MNTLLIAFILSIAVPATQKKDTPVSSSSGVSRGTATMSGASDGVLGPDAQEKARARQRSDSMGGAPNIGAGMGTGTGAGTGMNKKSEKKIDE